MGVTIFVDTNVLLYSISKDPLEQTKRETAIALLSGSDCVLSLQVINEFTWQSTHPKGRYGLPFERALTFVEVWRRFPVQSLDVSLFDLAVELKRRVNYSWWDCLIVAAAIAQGCDTLATEDMQHGRVLDGLRIVNPFRDLG